MHQEDAQFLVDQLVFCPICGHAWAHHRRYYYSRTGPGNNIARVGLDPLTVQPCSHRTPWWPPVGPRSGWPNNRGECGCNYGDPYYRLRIDLAIKGLLKLLDTSADTT